MPLRHRLAPRSRVASCVFAAFALVALAFAAPAAAQEGQPPPPGGPEGGPPGMQGTPQEMPDFEDEKLEAFVDAAVEVQGIVQTMQPKIAEAQDEQEGRALIAQTNEQIQTTIEEHPDISFDEYRQIAARAGQDPEFKARLDDMVREAMGGDMPPPGGDPGSE